MTGKYVLTEQKRARKSWKKEKNFEYFTSIKELKIQTSLAKKQYKQLSNSYEFDKIINWKNEKQHLKHIIEQNLIDDRKYSFGKFWTNLK